MKGSKYIKLLGIIIAVVIVNVLILSPGLLGIEIGSSTLATSFGITLLLISAIAIIYACYALLFQQPASLPVREIILHEDYVEALNRYRHVRGLEQDIVLALDQMDRMRKKKVTIMNVLNQRFEPAEISYKKFASVTDEVEKLFYLNVRSVLNRIHVFDESELDRFKEQTHSSFSPELLQKKASVYNAHISFIKDSLMNNEEILLKLDKLLLEISRLDSLEPGDIENMPCMKEIDELIKQTKLYKQ